MSNGNISTPTAIDIDANMLIDFGEMESNLNDLNMLITEIIHEYENDDVMMQACPPTSRCTPTTGGGSCS